MTHQPGHPEQLVTLLAACVDGSVTDESVKRYYEGEGSERGDGRGRGEHGKLSIGFACLMGVHSGGHLVKLM